MEKKVLFLVYKQSKAQSYCLPSSPSQFESLQDEKEEHKGLSTKDGHERVQSIDLQRGPRGVIRSQKKRKKRKEKGPREKLSNFTTKRLFLSSIGVKLWTHKNTPHYKTLFERRTTQNTQPSKWRTQNQWLNSPR